MDESPYKMVQGLSRGLSILRALNQADGGWASVRELAQATGLHRTTVRRLLETLQSEGVLRRSASDDSYRLTHEVRGLSDGFREEEWISEVASPVLGELLVKVVWPSDFATLDGADMRVRESTHRFSPLSFHKVTVRRRLPLVTTAAGRAYLAFCGDDEREDLLGRLAAIPDSPLRGPGRQALMVLLAQHREAGHAYNNGEWATEQRILALAVPVMQEGSVAGCINIVMLRSALSLAEARKRYLSHLHAAAHKIEEYLIAPR
ncbi:DNA-binding transcriptional regulator [Ochrobactrum sp. BTU2]|uniref:DNA-binding transcriptional regulator n=1 Tax=Ochrobactrum sp. BTU2 TaxID=2856166 RepID=UPI00211A86D0|nr:DNA-binding transcriptional regulator [Ochrobactrum sp. BTU2]MCQ9146161.1 DNA-binding transcriptional regulator [Ochrobactrum sp. BTU2]